MISDPHFSAKIHGPGNSGFLGGCLLIRKYFDVHKENKLGIAAHFTETIKLYFGKNAMHCYSEKRRK